MVVVVTVIDDSDRNLNVAHYSKNINGINTKLGILMLIIARQGA